MWGMSINVSKIIKEECMKEIKTKEDVFKAICNASRLGNLGFFCWLGFYKSNTGK